MSPFDVVVAVAGILCLAGLVRATVVLTNIGGDSHAFGPWDRPEPVAAPGRLPADFIALWSLFGERSMREYAGSWEAAVMRLDRLEAHLEEFSHEPRRSNHSPGPAPEQYSPAWLTSRIDELVALSGMEEATPIPTSTLPTSTLPNSPEQDPAITMRAT